MQNIKNKLKFTYSPPAQIRQRGFQSSRATISLAVILVAMLAFAQFLVSARGFPADAPQRAADLFKQVSQNGLSSYLPESSTQYYISYVGDEAIGYSIHNLQKTTNPNGETFIEMTHSFLNLKSKLRTTDLLVIKDDLSEFTQFDQNGFLSKGHPVELIEQRYKDGVLLISSPSDRTKTKINLEKEGLIGFIPSPLLDIFSAVAMTNPDYQDGIIFRLSYPQFSHKLFIPILVELGGDTPTDIKKIDTDGRSVKTRWLLGQIRSEQELYYGSDHTLLWQKDFDEDSVQEIRIVSKEELIKQFPQAQIDLRSRFEMDNDDDREML